MCVDEMAVSTAVDAPGSIEEVSFRLYEDTRRLWTCVEKEGRCPAGKRVSTAVDAPGSIERLASVCMRIRDGCGPV